MSHRQTGTIIQSGVCSRSGPEARALRVRSDEPMSSKPNVCESFEMSSKRSLSFCFTALELQASMEECEM